MEIQSCLNIFFVSAFDSGVGVNLRLHLRVTLLPGSNTGSNKRIYSSMRELCLFLSRPDPRARVTPSSCKQFPSLPNGSSSDIKNINLCFNWVKNVPSAIHKKEVNINENLIDLDRVLAQNYITVL